MLRPSHTSSKSRLLPTVFAPILRAAADYQRALVAILLLVASSADRVCPLESQQSTPRLIVGLIDTGIDAHHPDLLRHGKSVIYKLWDQRDRSRNNGPDGTSAEYTGCEIDTCALLGDQEGHGTAVASVICDGAPGQAGVDWELVCVSVTRNASQTEVAAGIAYIRSVAEREKRPYLINLSVGFAGGAKDGVTDTLEYAVKRLFDTDSLGLLKQVITAAGNSHYDSTIIDNLHTASLTVQESISIENRRGHARGRGTRSFCLNLNTTPESDDDHCVVEVWYPASRPYLISLQTPSHDVIVPPPDAGVWEPDPAKVLQKFGYVEISNLGPVQGSSQEPPVWACTKILLRDDTTGHGPLMGGNWTIALRSGVGTWDAYITAVGPKGTKKAIKREQVSNECLLDVGANVARAVTVGSYNPCDTCRWETIDGSTAMDNSHTPGKAISHFSSRGPTRSGIDKPEIYAPGQCRKVALSGHLDEQAMVELVNGNLITRGSRHFIAEGSSYAAPEVTNAVIAMLLDRPCLGSDEIKHALVASSDNIYDRGKLCHLLNRKQALKFIHRTICR